jgi:osmotically-inducible protein OsmY
VGGRSLFVWLAVVLAIRVAIFPLPARGQQGQVPQKAVERIQKEVRHEILMLPYLTVFDNLGYKVDGYDVTLVGQVIKPSLKSDAESAVKRIEGVEKVD